MEIEKKTNKINKIKKPTRDKRRLHRRGSLASTIAAGRVTLAATLGAQHRGGELQCIIVFGATSFSCGDSFRFRPVGIVKHNLKMKLPRPQTVCLASMPKRTRSPTAKNKGRREEGIRHVSLASSLLAQCPVGNPISFPNWSLPRTCIRRFHRKLFPRGLSLFSTPPTSDPTQF